MTEQQQERPDETDGEVLIVYTDNEGKVHEFDGDASSLTFKQLWDIQKVTGLNGLGPIADALGEMNAPALMALLWVHLREEQPDVTFSDINTVRLNQIEFRQILAEPADPKGSAPTDSDSSTWDDAKTSSPSSPSSDSTSE